MIKILDCTLRDGGYLNEWNFQDSNQVSIITELDRSNIDYIEFGWLKKSENNNNKTFFTHSDEVNNLINMTLGDNNSKKLLMLDINQYDEELIDALRSEKLYGIRVAFYESSLSKLDQIVSHLNQSGYRVFLQPMNTFGFKRSSLDHLFTIVNEKNIDCISIVDSFGSVNSLKLNSMYTLYKSMLKKNIPIGLHLHDNKGLAVSNALSILEKFPNDDIIIDSTLLGIGRGGGNVKTESISIIMNEILNSEKYDICNLFSIGWNYLKDIDTKYDLLGKSKTLMTGYFGVHPYYADYINSDNLDSITINSFFSSIIDKEDYRSSPFYIDLKAQKK